MGGVPLGACLRPPRHHVEAVISPGAMKSSDSTSCRSSAALRRWVPQDRIARPGRDEERGERALERHRVLLQQEERVGQRRHLVQREDTRAEVASRAERQLLRPHPGAGDPRGCADVGHVQEGYVETVARSGCSPEHAARERLLHRHRRGERASSPGCLRPTRPPARCAPARRRTPACRWTQSSASLTSSRARERAPSPGGSSR